MHHYLAHFPLFLRLSDAELAEIAGALEPPRQYTKGEVIYRDHTFRRAIGLIVRGTVTVQKQAVMMNRLHAGEMFGAAALFDESDTYVTEITAEGDTEIVFIPQETMSALLLRYPSLSENYIRFLSGRIRFLNRKLAVLAIGSAEHRLYEYLSANADADGTITLPPSMVELAHTLNIGRSSLYRSLDALQNAGVLTRDGRCYRLTK